MVDGTRRQFLGTIAWTGPIDSTVAPAVASTATAPIIRSLYGTTAAGGSPRRHPVVCELPRESLHLLLDETDRLLWRDSDRDVHEPCIPADEDVEPVAGDAVQHDLKAASSALVIGIREASSGHGTGNPSSV